MGAVLFVICGSVLAMHGALGRGEYTHFHFLLSDGSVMLYHFYIRSKESFCFSSLTDSFA